MKRTFCRTLILSSLLTGGMAVGAHANDLSLHPLGQDTQLASLAPSSQLGDSPSQLFKPRTDSGDITIQQVDVWERIRKGYGIPELTDNALVDKQLEWYGSRPDYIRRTTDRASRYLFHIVQELEARGMPTELALLPFIESAFNPHAKSTAKAVGMWQFIPSTGRSFNLNQSALKDERRNVLASTEAALNYLQKLYDMFGDWQLALAAYNWGEGSVQKAIRKNQAAGLPTDFNSLSDRMPAETRNYVPKLQAVKSIIANPDKYGITLPKIDNQPFFVNIGKTRDMDVAVAAKLAEMSVDDFRALNPQFGQHVITGGTKTQILLPQENADKFKANLEKTQGALSSWTTYKVTGSREKIEAIAEKFGAKAELLREANNIPPKMLLRAGSTILVPKTDKTADKDIAPEIAENATISVERDGPSTRRITIKVGKNDSLASLAKRHRVTTSQIQTWNKINGTSLTVGAKLELHVPVKTASAKSGKKSTRTAKGKTGNKKKKLAAGKSSKKRRG